MHTWAGRGASAVAAAGLAAALALGPAQGALAATTGPSAPGGPWGWPGTKAQGWLPPHEPAVHGGTVKVGLITAGTVHDGGYYQSEADALAAAAKKHHWKTVVQGSVSAADALSAAQNMCSQGVDLLVIGETQLAAAVPAASTKVCQGTPVWIYGSTGTVTASPYLSVSETTEDPQSYATGVAMGLWLKDHHQTTAGFITGPALTFLQRPARAYLAGMRSVTAADSLDAVYTGSLTASGPAITAAGSMLAKGVKLIYPFLGASLLPTARYITSHGGATLTAGGKWCSHNGVTFAIEQVYNPGYQLAPALEQFAKGTLRVGVVRTWVLGETAVPSVSFCSSAKASKADKAALKAVIAKLATGAVNATRAITATPTPT